MYVRVDDMTVNVVRSDVVTNLERKCIFDLHDLFFDDLELPYRFWNRWIWCYSQGGVVVAGEECA